MNIAEMREHLDDYEPNVDRKRIEGYIRQMRKEPEAWDANSLEIFTLIEQCNSWYKAYLEIAEKIQQEL